MIHISIKVRCSNYYMQTTDYNLIRAVTKPANLKILFAIKSGKEKWSDFERILNKKQVSDSLKELIELGLVKTEKREKGLKEYKIYKLTEAGRYVIEYLERVESILRDTKTLKEKKENTFI